MISTENKAMPFVNKAESMYLAVVRVGFACSKPNSEHGWVTVLFRPDLALSPRGRVFFRFCGKS